jgi:hypothetical protein
MPYALLSWKSENREEYATLPTEKVLTGKSSTLDFAKHASTLETQDNCELRAKILSLTASQAKQLGIRKSTLHYLRRRAQCEHPFAVQYKIRTKLNESWACD